MFLKKIKPNKRILYNKYFIDPWASIIIKKKLKNRTTQRFLQFFGRYLIANKFSGRRVKPAHLRKNIKRRTKARAQINAKQPPKIKKVNKKKARRAKSPYHKRKSVRSVHRNKKAPSKPAQRDFIKPSKTVVQDPLRSFIYARMRFYACYKSASQNLLVYS